MGRMKKRLTKRKTLKLKYKIERKVRDSNRKSRKEEKENPKKKKGINLLPNSYPFKDEEISRLEMERQKVIAEKERQRIQRRKELQKKRLAQAEAQNEGGKVTSEMLLTASQRAAEFEAAQAQGNDEDEQDPTSRISQRNHIRELKKMFEMSDVLLEVLDARDPLGCRCTNLEQLVDSNVNKKLILVLNKIDLVPTDVVKKWLAYFRRTHPTIAFKASTQSRGHIRSSSVSAHAASSDALKSSDSIGGDMLVQLLKNYSRSHNLKKSIVVGVFGYPNVGKSSLINSLKRAKAVGVSSCPGFTKTVQQIHLDKHIKLVDCPGVVFDSDSGSSDAVILRNAVAVEKVPNPQRVVEAIIDRCSPESIARHYKIAAFKDSVEFLSTMAKLRGKMLLGGRRDLEAAARSVLHDWNNGKIPFYTLPPANNNAQDANGESMVDDATAPQIVTEWAKEFDIGALFQEEAEMLDKDPTSNSSNFIAMTSSSARHAALDEDEDDDDDEIEEDDEDDGEEGDSDEGEMDEE
eukprot:c32483_g1_i1.p1 GENE.c32483_g1_i1~~c32483_g1_i1.p1  ORF type:complete len:520 (+),score=164.02 c32483_g1_i1:60-1619(+)